jgi:CRP-like cAMP-binding protein
VIPLPLASLTELIGVAGVLLYLGSYAALQLGFLHGQTYTCAGLNALAAGCVLFSLSSSFNLPSALIQISWITISLAGILRLYVTGLIAARIPFSDDERAFLSSKLPALPKQQARRLLDAGYWIDGEPGSVLAQEGKPVGELAYLARGEAAVSLDSHVNGYCRDDTFIGELTCMTGAPATATDTIAAPSRYFCIGVASLRQLATPHSALRQALEDSFASDTRKKLVMAGRHFQRQHRAREAAGIGF